MSMLSLSYDPEKHHYNGTDLCITVVGHFNLRPLSDFKRGQEIEALSFEPKDPAEPIVLAVKGSGEYCFIYIHRHLDRSVEACTVDYAAYETDELSIFCDKKSDLWSIRENGSTFVYSQTKKFIRTYVIHNCDLLCAFVAGCLPTEKLREKSYFNDDNQQKFSRMDNLLRETIAQLQAAEDSVERLSAVGETGYAAEQAENPPRLRIVQ